MKLRNNLKTAYICGGLGAILMTGNASAASTLIRYVEGGAYPLQTFVEEPHTRLDTEFPAATVAGDAAKTSDNQWAALLNSNYVIGGQSSLTRGRDVLQDGWLYFVDPATPLVNYFFSFADNNSSASVARTGYPTTLTSGPMGGQSVLANNKLLAVGDAQSVWWDAVTGKVSYYNQNGTFFSTPTATSFTGITGPYNGQTIASKLSKLVGFEGGNLYFLEGPGTINVYNSAMAFVRTDTVTLSGPLAGKTLGDVVDGKVAGYTYVGWDAGPVVLAASIPEPGGPALVVMTAAGVMLWRRRRA